MILIACFQLAADSRQAIYAVSTSARVRGALEIQFLAPRGFMGSNLRRFWLPADSRQAKRSASSSLRTSAELAAGIFLPGILTESKK